MIKSKKMRDSANGETCTLILPGICNRDPSTTVFAHLPDESNGIGKKPDDISGCYACSNCHDFIDGRAPRIQHIWDICDFYMRRAQTRTMRRMIDKGIVRI